MRKNDIISIDWSPVIKAQEQCSQKIIQKTAKAILKKTNLADNPPKKKFSFKSANDLKELYTLAAYLFVFEEYELCYAISCICDHVVFNGNYDIWNLVEKLRIMKICILKTNGDKERAQSIVDSLREHEAPMENYIRNWEFLYNRAITEFSQMYSEAKDGKRTPSVVRFLIMGTAMACVQYIQMEYIPEKHELMKDWSEKIFEFLRAEEK